MKTISTFLFVAACQVCFAGVDTNIVAMSDWSEPVGYREVGYLGSGPAIRGRLILWKGFTPGYAGKTPETAIYVELQNMTTSGSQCEFYFGGGEGLRCELFKGDGEKVEPSVGGGYGNGPGPFGVGGWITLPHDSTIRLRANAKGGTPDGYALAICMWKGQWYIRDGDTNTYSLSATLSITSPTNRVTTLTSPIWKGTLTFPKMKISVPK